MPLRNRPSCRAPRSWPHARLSPAAAARPSANRKSAGGRDVCLPQERQQKILDTTLKTRPPDATHWSVRGLARHLRVSRMMVYRVWQRYDIQPHRVEKFKISNDPHFEEKVRDVGGPLP